MRLAIILLFLISSSSLWGQCPHSDSIIARISFLKNNPVESEIRQLEELLASKERWDKCSKKKDSAYAYLLQRIGWLYRSKHDFKTAIAFTKQSSELMRHLKNKSSFDESFIIKNFWNLHFLYDSAQQTAKKYEALDSCIFKSIASQDYNFADVALLIVVPHLFEIGDYYRCSTYASFGENIITKISSLTDEEIADEYINYFTWRINSLLNLHAYAEAEAAVKTKIKAAELTGNILQLAPLYGLYGSILANKNENILAVEYFQRCFNLNMKQKYKTGCSEALNNIGFIYQTKLKQNHQALSYFFKALRFSDTKESLNILGNIANAYFSMHQYDSALVFYQKAFDQISPGFKETDLSKDEGIALANNFTKYVTGMALDKAAALLRYYQITNNKKVLKDVIICYKNLDRYFEKLKSSQTELQSKLFWKTSSRRLYEGAIEACYLARNTEDAFYFFERGRSILLNDEITEQRNMNGSTLAKQAKLKKRILKLEYLLKQDNSAEKLLDLQQQLITAKQKLDDLGNRSKNRASPNPNGETKEYTPSIESVQKSIAINKISLLETFAGDSAVYLLAITSNNTSFIKVDEHLYDSLTSRFISFVGSSEKLNRDFKGFVSSAHALYNLIFSQLQLPETGSLIISPDGKSFPFEALIKNTDIRQPQYLLYQYATSYTYSAKYLLNEYAANESENSLLGFAPVRYVYDQSLTELTGSDASLETINQYFLNNTSFTFGKATRSNFLDHLPDYSIVQLYTHAADSSSRNNPVIYFSDTTLYLEDLILDRQPKTQLVVLSACETANGKLYKGEGIFSFNRGFAALGIPAAVSNLWSVNSQSTYTITELFYKYIDEGNPTDIALQKAKIAFLKLNSSTDKRLPYYWAGTILVGKIDTIGKKHFPWIIIIFSLIVVTTAIGLIIYFNQKRKKTEAAFISSIKARPSGINQN